MKYISIIILGLLISCMGKNSNSINEENINEGIKQILTFYIDSNNLLNYDKQDIVVQCSTLDSNVFRIVVLSTMKDGLCYSSNYDDVDIFCCNYMGFRVFFIDENCNINYFNYRPEKINLSNLCVGEFVPNTYNGPYWEFRIKDRSVINFYYKYCAVNDELINELKKTQIYLK